MYLPNCDICKDPPKVFITLYKKAKNPLPGEPESKVTSPFMSVSNAVNGEIKYIYMKFHIASLVEKSKSSRFTVTMIISPTKTRVNRISL